jgi:pimeloyl-ACP methyl ester carboxylesterase
MAAVRTRDVAFIILMAGPSVNGERIIMYQVEHLTRSGGASESEVASALALQTQVFTAVRSGKGWDELEKKLKEEIARGIARMGPSERASVDSAEAVNSRSQIQLAGAKTPWFKYFAEYDPAPALQKVACPVLALFGELDNQVPPGLNREPMEKALRAGGNNDWQIKVLPKANHLFLPSVTGNPAEYPAMEKQFVPGFLDLMADWIARRVTIVRR